jgi:uncharacterized protein YceK
MYRKALIIIMAVIMTLVAAGCSQTAEHTGAKSIHRNRSRF